MSVLRGKLQLVGTACMLIAAKFEEIYPPDISDFVYITDDTYNAKQVCASNCLWFSSSVSEVQDMLTTNYLQSSMGNPLVTDLKMVERVLEGVMQEKVHVQI